MMEQTVSGSRVIAQVDFIKQRIAISSASLIIARACRNRAAILTRFRAYQRRYPARARLLTRYINQIHQSEKALLKKYNPRQKIFLLEAQASAAYWRGFSLLINHVDPNWQRVYPHAKDPINIILNTGYTLLARQVKKAIVSAGILPEIGLLHSSHNNKIPLVYDVMELFRQPIVDAVVLPLFTKKKRSLNTASPLNTGQVINLINERWLRPVNYNGRCHSIKEIAKYECRKLAKAMESQNIYQPYLYSWGHKSNCYIKRSKKKALS